MKWIFGILPALSLRDIFYDFGCTPNLIEMEQYYDAGKCSEWVENPRQYKVSNLTIFPYDLLYLLYLLY